MIVPLRFASMDTMPAGQGSHMRDHWDPLAPLLPVRAFLTRKLASHTRGEADAYVIAHFGFCFVGEQVVGQHTEFPPTEGSPVSRTPGRKTHLGNRRKARGRPLSENPPLRNNSGRPIWCILSFCPPSCPWKGMNVFVTCVTILRNVEVNGMEPKGPNPKNKENHTDSVPQCLMEVRAAAAGTASSSHCTGGGGVVNANLAPFLKYHPKFWYKIPRFYTSIDCEWWLLFPVGLWLAAAVSWRLGACESVICGAKCAPQGESACREPWHLENGRGP